MNRKIVQSPITPALREYIYAEFANHAIQSVGHDGLENDPIAFQMNDNDINIAACCVQLFWGNLHIKYLLVHEQYRRQGIAKLLIQHALDYGKDKGCKFAFVETMSFQALDFYKNDQLLR